VRARSIKTEAQLMRLFFIALCLIALVACSEPASQNDAALSGQGVTIYNAAAIVTLGPNAADVTGVAVRDGYIVEVGKAEKLSVKYSGAEIDTTFANLVIIPGLIDPHIHMALSSLQYATPLTPPWAMATGDGIVPGLKTREAFFQKVREIEAAAPAGEPLIIYGFHNLVHGDLTKEDLDAITTSRPLIIWHYSSHDFYLNSEALKWANVDASLHERFEGIDLGADGELTGRIYEDAIGYLMQAVGPILLAPDRLAAGYEEFSQLLRTAGVTTVADLGYGIFGRGVEDAHISANWRNPQQAGYRLYLVPEHRAMVAEFGDGAAAAALAMSKGEMSASAPVLPQVKFFTDAAFYSQTMRISSPGYLAGQSKGSEGLWVTGPDILEDTIRPYWEAGLGVRIHSNGDAAQTATLDALEALRASDTNLRFIVEHGGMFSPEQVERAAALGAGISAASHYVFYLGNAYVEPLGAERAAWITPLRSLSAAGVPVTVHSDAPLAPPIPLLAASVHMTRTTREGSVFHAEEKLSAMEALEAITLDAAYALGLEDEIGSIAPGKRADFTIVDANPLATPGEAWDDIGVWGVVLDGVKRPAP
jgi:predicted amidohydrolase YtcJ